MRKVSPVLSHWQGAAALNQTVAYLGRTLFKSQEYINLGRSDAQFVSDLYWAYLQRAPDGQSNNTNTGWGWWTSQVPGAGRDAVREAFANDPNETWVRNGEMCPRTSGASGPIPTDGLASLTFNAASNRIATSGFQYDTAGNQTQTVRVDGSLQRFQYDAANRLVKVFDGNGYTLQTTTYGATNQRLRARLRQFPHLLRGRHRRIYRDAQQPDNASLEQELRLYGRAFAHHLYAQWRRRDDAIPSP